MALLERRGMSAGWAACLAALCAAIGISAGVNPAYGIAGALAVAFCAVVVADAVAGLALFTAISFLEVLTNTGGAAGDFFKLAGLLLFASWLAGASAGTRQSWLVSPFQASPTALIGGIALVAWAALSISWAYSAGDAASETTRYVLSLLLIPIVFGTVRRKEHVTWVAAAFVVGAVFSTVYGFVHPTAATSIQAGQLTGALGDANAEAAVLVAAIALAFGLLRQWRHRPWLRMATVIAILVSFGGVVNTLSRSGLIALMCMMVTAVVFGGRWRPQATLLLVVSVLAGVSYIAVIAPLRARERVTSSNTSGRSTIWKVGWRMVEAHPVAGVGAGNFRAASIHYLQAPGGVTRADLIVDDPKVAHNIYLEMLADLGIPGLLAFLTLLLGSVAAAMRAARSFERTGEGDLELMSRCVVFALVGFAVADFFVSGQFVKQLWIVLALGPTMLALARSREREIQRLQPAATGTPPTRAPLVVSHV